MAFPTSPTNGQIYTDTTTKRRWKYDSATTTWLLIERQTLKDYTSVNVTTVAPIEGDLFTYDSTNSYFKNNSAILSDFLDISDGHALAPTINDEDTEGTVWRDSTNEEAYFNLAATPPGTATTINVASTVTGPLTVNATERIAQSFTVSTAYIYNRLTINTSSTGTYDLQLDIYSGTNVDGTPLMTTTISGVSVIPGPVLLPFPDLYMAAGTYSWKVTSLAGNAAFNVRISSGTTYTAGSPQIGTNVVHSLTLLASSKDWAFQFGYDIPRNITTWLKWAYPAPLNQGVYKGTTPYAEDTTTDGIMWYDSTTGRVFMYDGDAGSWVQL